MFFAIRFLADRLKNKLCDGELIYYGCLLKSNYGARLQLRPFLVGLKTWLSILFFLFSLPFIFFKPKASLQDEAFGLKMSQGNVFLKDC